MPHQKPFIPDIPDDRKHEIIKLLTDRGVHITPCPACKNFHPAVLSGLEILETSTTDTVIIPPEPNVIKSQAGPRHWKSAIVICKNCGYRSEFHLEFLK